MALFHIESVLGNGFATAYALPLLLAYVCLRCIYRLTVHPLANVPGPFLNCISSWPDYVAAVSGDRHRRIWQLHETYGPVVRIGPNRVSFNTLEAFQTIYDGKAKLRKGLIYETFIAANSGRVDTLTASRRDPTQAIHNRKRKILSRAFSERALRMNEGSMIQHQRSWLDQVTKQSGHSNGGDAWSDPLDVYTWISYLTLDTVADIGFSRNFGLTKHERFRYLPKVFDGLLRSNIAIAHTPPFLQSMINILLKSPFMALLIPAKVRKFDQFADDMIAERVYQELNQQAVTDGEKPGSRDDFVRLFRDQKGGFDHQAVAEIKSEATLLLIAGADTVATALSAILFYLTQHRQCLEKLVSELDSCVTNEQNIRRENVSQAKYLRACIDESLRLSPPLPGYLPREVTSSGITIAEQYFPPGVEVGVCTYALHLNPENYPHPFEFSPERWLVGEGNNSTIKWQQDLVVARSAFAPFSTGFASCVGREFAYMEISLLLTRILYLYDIKRADMAAGTISHTQEPGGGTNTQYELEDHFTSTGTGPWIQFRKRR